MRSMKLVAATLAVAAALVPLRARAAVTGAIEGTVTDQSNGKKLAGVTVTVTSPALQGEQTEFTDPAGHYIITELPPGEYLVRFYFSDKVVERPGVFVSSDRTLAVNISFPTQQAAVKTYRITEKAPTVDVGNTQVQTQVSSELVRNTPVRGRTFDSVLALAPGAATDPVGFSFNGATGPENNFLIDGVNTTSPSFGLIGTRLTLEFVGETEIITGGYNAEYGRATGGVVNVITKSGSNQFHGDVWFYATPFQLEPSKAIGRISEAIAQKTHDKYSFDFGFDLGGPIVKDKIWFYVGFAPTFTTRESDRFLQRRTSDLITPGATTYSGDPDNSIGCPSYFADKGLCTSGAFKMQRLGSQYDKHYDTNSRLYNIIAKFNFQLNSNNSLILQYIASPGTFDGILPLSGSLNKAALGDFNGDDKQLLSSEFDNTHDALLHYVSKLADRRLQLDIIAGYHYEHSEVKPNGNDSRIQDLNVRSLDFYENVPDCKPYTPNGTTAVFTPCPVQNYLSNGHGFNNIINSQRISVAASATYFARFGGTHALKLGFDFEDNIYNDHRFYTGGGQYQLRTDGRFRWRFIGTVDPTDPTLGKILPDGINSTTSTLNYGLYLRDSYNVGFVPGLTVNAGVRWEAQEVKDYKGNTQIGIYDNVAPRVGAIYDFTRKGRSKVYASYGWFFESIPLDINDRQFSIGDFGNLNSNRGTCTPDATGHQNLSQCVFPTPPKISQINGGGRFGTVSPVIKGQYSTEVVAGIQYDVGFDLVLGAAYIHRDLPRIIEDMSPDGGATFVIGNPSAPTDQGAVRDLQRKIAAATDPATKADLQRTLYLYQGNATFEKPQRNYDALVITANKRLSHNFLMLASYTYSRTLGNYPGNFLATTGQLDPNISAQYDVRDLLTNAHGPLDNDRPHNLKIQGSYFVPFGKNNMTFGLAFNLVSGTPISVLGNNANYGANTVFILPRGAGGRTPLVTSFDLHVGYRRQLSRIFTLDAYWDIFNLFNQQEITIVDQNYTADNVLPIPNGTVADLRNLRTNTGVQPLLNPNYGRANGPNAYQAPLSMRLGVRLSF